MFQASITKPALLLFIDRDCGVWMIQHRNENGEVIVEQTNYPASMPSLVVSDAIQQARPGSAILAKIA